MGSLKIKKRKQKRQSPELAVEPQKVESGGDSSQSTGVTGVWLVAMALIAISVFFWSYFPVLTKLVSRWNRVADYSHGYLVVPIALGMLWVCRDRMPKFSFNARNFTGLLLIALAAVMRWYAAKYYVDAIAGWSIPFWVAGAVLLIFGWRAMVWSLPATVFLMFMIPLPYFLETAVARPLQVASAKISCFIFQCFVLPAALEGNTILLGGYTLEVARACSGLRITLGVAALAYAFAVLFRRPVAGVFLMAIAVLPIAVLSNSIRIVITGLLYQFGFSESVMKLVHDGAGMVMLPIAAVMFLMLNWYIDQLLPQEEEFTTTRLLNRRQVAEA